jgi:hypothetical protein
LKTKTTMIWATFQSIAEGVNRMFELLTDDQKRLDTFAASYPEKVAVIDARQKALNERYDLLMEQADLIKLLHAQVNDLDQARFLEGYQKGRYHKKHGQSAVLFGDKEQVRSDWNSQQYAKWADHF